MSYISQLNWLIEIQKGNVAGHSLVHKFGRNDAVPNGTWEFITNLGHTSWPLSAATTVRIKSGGNAADDSAGNGAREVTVQGIDSNLAEVTEAITTNGASASSATTASFWRVHRAWVSSAGTYGSANTGAITIENSAGGTDLIQIVAEDGQTQFGGYSVPIGKTAYLLGVYARVDGNKPADIRMMTRDNFNDASAPLSSKRLKLYFDGVASELKFTPHSPTNVFNALTDVWFETRGDGVGTEVSVDFELLLVDD